MKRFVLSADAERKLEELRQLAVLPSQAVVLRNALAVFDLLVRAQRDGAVILVRRPDGIEQELDQL